MSVVDAVDVVDAMDFDVLLIIGPVDVWFGGCTGVVDVAVVWWI